jgi:elongation factor G
MYKYSTQLRSITQGKGTFTQKFAYYQEMPKEVQEKLVEQRAGEKEER